jgi:cell division transport system permease protein
MSRKEDRYTSNRLKSSYVTTIVSISLVLFSIGLIGLLLLHAKKLSDYVKENISFSVIMNKNVKEVDVFKLQKKLDAEPYVKSTEFIPEDKAAQNFQKDMGQDFVTFIGYNPLHTSIEVHLKAEFASEEQFDEIEKDLLKNENVKEVFYQKSLIHLVNENVQKISLFILGFSFLLIIIAVALINNTIRLSVYSKRFLIKSMQLVGATESFIRRPFIRTEVLHGFFASIIAIGGLVGVIYLARKEIPEIVSLQSADLFAFLFLFVIITGFLMTWLSTFFAVRRFLKAKTDTLYYQY